MSLHGYSDGEYDDGSDVDNVTLISKLDVIHPLHLHPNDSVALTVVSMKLKGTENYQVWSNTDEVLGRQWERVNVVVLGLHHKIHTLSQNGSSITDYYHKLNALWKQFNALIELPRSAYAIISSEESHRIATGSVSGTSQRSQTSAFNVNAPNIGNFKRSQTSTSFFRPSNNNRHDDNRNRRTAGGSTLVCENCGFNGHSIDKCFKIIGYFADFGKRKVGLNFKGKNVSNNVVGSSSSNGFSDEQMATFISLIKENSVNGKRDSL
ncbi:hypothetical protein Tco_0657804 [Tanacetum coccineum]